MDWISVNEKLPEIGKLVLCYDEECGPEVGKYERTDYYSDGDVHIFQNTYDEYITVSYWTDIPPYPKINNNYGKKDFLCISD